MKALPVIIAVVAVVALVRRRRGRGPSPRMGAIVARLQGRTLLGDTGLVAGREIRERVRGRLFWVVTVMLFGVVPAAVVIPTLHARTTRSQRVGVVASSAPLEAELHDLAKSAGLSVALVNEPGLSQARAALSAGQLDMVVDSTGKILMKRPIPASGTSAKARYVRAVSVALGAQHAFTQAGLTPQQAATVAKAKPVALAQAVTLVAFALALAGAVGSSLVHGAAPLVIAATLAWLVLGYAFYSWVYAAAGSLAERQDQVQSLALPLSAPLIFGYIVSLIGVSSGSPSLLVKVLAYLPPTAPFAMPTLIGFGEATWWQFLLSVAVTLVCTLVVAFAAAQVYRTAVLQTGRRVRLRELLPALTK